MATLPVAGLHPPRVSFLLLWLLLCGSLARGPAAGEAAALVRDKEKAAADRAIEAVVHSAEQADKLVLETQQEASAGDLLPSEALAAAAAIALGCALVVTLWRWRRRHKATSTPASSAMATAARVIALTPPIATPTTDPRVSSSKTAIDGAKSVASSRDRRSASAVWSFVLRRNADSSRESNRGSSCSRSVEVATPRPSAEERDSTSEAVVESASRRWRSRLATRLRQLKPTARSPYSRTATAPTRSYV